MKTGSHAGGWHPSSKYMAITWKSFSNRSPRAFGVRSRTCGPGDCTRHCQHRTPRHRPRVAVRRHRIWPWSVRLCATQHVLIEAPVKLREACGNALCKLDLLGLVISAARICRVLRGEARLAEALQVAQHVVLRFAYFSVALAFLPQTEQRIAVRRAACHGASCISEHWMQNCVVRSPYRLSARARILHDVQRVVATRAACHCGSCTSAHVTQHDVARPPCFSIDWAWARHAVQAFAFLVRCATPDRALPRMHSSTL